MFCCQLRIYFRKSIILIKYPLGFIIGNPRSGTTFFLQYLASLGCFSYPTNILARFAYAPHIGALIQQMLFNKQFDPLNELNIQSEDNKFESNLGKTKGALVVNEFHHFFRGYINNYFPQYIEENEIKNLDFDAMAKGLTSIEDVFDLPFVTKNMMFQYNINELFEKIPNCIFFYIKRNSIDVMQSILNARNTYFNDDTKWWSVKTKRVRTIKRLRCISSNCRTSLFYR
jgi:hypothetical protein